MAEAEFVVDDNIEVLVEFPAKAGVRDVARKKLSAEELVEKSRDAMDRAMSTIHYMARRVAGTIDTLDLKPDSEILKKVIKEFTSQ